MRWEFRVFRALERQETAKEYGAPLKAVYHILRNGFVKGRTSMMMGHETTSDAIKNALKNLAAHAPAPKLSRLEQQLAEHRDLLLKAIAKGHTTKAIAATLKDAGLEATPDSLTRMIRRVAATVAKNGTAGKASGK